MKIIKFISYTIFIAGLLYGCKSAKSTTNSNAIISLSSKKIIKSHYKNSINFKTLKGRAKVRYEDKRTGQTITANIRIEKGKSIWVSASFLGFVGAKALITPTKARYYNKLDKTYFEGDFGLLANLLGTDLNYEQLENMLMGQAIFDLTDERYDSEVYKKVYKLQPESDILLFKKLFFLNPDNFKMAEQRLIQPEEKRLLAITYPSYQKVSGRILPKEITIIANENTYQTKIAFQYRSVTLDEKVTFPFKIPSGYEEIQIK